jgi:hypothetical protein
MLPAIHVPAKPNCLFTSNEQLCGYRNIMLSNESKGHTLNMSTNYLTFGDFNHNIDYIAIVRTNPIDKQVFSFSLNINRKYRKDNRQTFNIFSRNKKHREIMSIVEDAKLIEDKAKNISKQLISNSIEGYFNYLYNEWQKEIKFISFMGNNTNEYYNKIINLGKPVMPYIINKLRKEPCHLFIALSEITSENPVKQEHQGLIHEMASDWIHWWDMKNYDMG